MATRRKDGFRDRLEHFAKIRKLAEKSRRTGKPFPPLEERGVKPFLDPVQNVIEYTTVVREYHHPFNYQNITHHCFCNDPSNSGLEINPVNAVDSVTPVSHPADYLELKEKDPIVRIEVIGSACTPPGYITLEADPCEGFRRPDELPELMPVRMRIDNLWGTHIRGDCWIKDKKEGGVPLPKHFADNWPYCYKADFTQNHVYSGITADNFPAAGMSCAIFEIPASRTVRISGGSQMYSWLTDKALGDCHYSFRLIRTTVLKKYEAVVEEKPGI